MGIIILRFIVIFYVLGLLFLIINLMNKDIVKNKRSVLGLIFFPVLVITSQGRKFLKEIIKGAESHSLKFELKILILDLFFLSK